MATIEQEERWVSKGWFFSEDYGMWVSPKGRLAYEPGYPFDGQLSKQELEEAKKTGEERDKSLLESLEELAESIKKVNNSLVGEPEPTERDIARIVMVPRNHTGGVPTLYDYRVEYK